MKHSRIQIEKATKISALSSNNLDKYEYLTREDLKFYYSPLGNIFTKGFKEEDKKEGLLKKLKNIEDKNEEQLKIIGNETGINSQIDLFDEDLTSEAVALIKEIIRVEDSVDYSKLFFMGGNKKVYSLDSFMTLEKLIKDILSKNMKIDRAEIRQNN